MNRLDDWSGDSPWAIPAAFAPTSACHKLFTAGSDGKESAYSAGGPGSIPGSGRSPEEGRGNPLPDSCLENPMDRGACGAAVHGVTKSQTLLNEFHSATHFMPQVAHCQCPCFSSWSVFLTMGSMLGPRTG